MSKKSALVFGASSLGGWSLVRECLSYPSPDVFDQVIGLSNRPLAKSELLLEEADTDRVHLHSGIDLTSGPESVIGAIQKIPKIEKTTHVFYTAYGGHKEAYAKADPFPTLIDTNLKMLQAAITAINKLCPDLESWVLQTGAKAYGVEFVGQDGFSCSIPMTESTLPLPAPFGSKIFYNAQHDELEERSRGQKWSFCDVIPSIITGHAPRASDMNLAQTFGFYLALYADVHGRGAEVAFPGSEASYRAKESDVPQDLLAQFSIFAALKSSSHTTAAGERYNVVAGAGGVATFEQMWPDMCAFFGLKGVAPKSGKEGEERGDLYAKSLPAEIGWVMANKDRWAQLEDKHGLQKGLFDAAGWPFFAGVTNFAVFDRQMDSAKARALGFEATSSVLDGYINGFKRMRQAKMIP